MNILFLSCDSLSDFVVDDNLLVDALKQEGHAVTTLSWSRDSDWSQFDCAIIRTTWDYMKYPSEFFQKLTEISQVTPLFNSLSTVKWNIHKSYLKDFEMKGINIVPTLFFSSHEEVSLPSEWLSKKLVVKPTISAGSYETTVIEGANFSQHKSQLSMGDWMCQPFLEEIKQGEVSLIYFNKIFSHALLKVPKEGDFRVQEEFGGDIIPLDVTPELKAAGDKVMSIVTDDLLYARVDLVKYQGKFALMELELIEPALYFRTHKDATSNFIKALHDVKVRETRS